MKLRASGNALKQCVETFNRTSAMADEVKKADETLFLHLYETKAENVTLNAFWLHSVKEMFEKECAQVGIPSPYFY